MTDRNEGSPHTRSDGPEVDDTNVATSPRRKRDVIKQTWRRKTFKAGAGLLAVAGVTTLIGSHQAGNWNERLAGFQAAEAQLIDKQRKSNNAQCLGRTLLINSGTVLRSTPNSVNFSSIIPTSSWFAKDNRVDTVKRDEELQVKLPKLSLDADSNQWISFRLVDKTTNQKIKPGPIKNSAQIADETVWVNYGELKDATNSKGEQYIEEKSLEGAPDMPVDLVDCEIEIDGQTTINDRQAAIGKKYPYGHFDEITEFMTYPKAG